MKISQWRKLPLQWSIVSEFLQVTPPLLSNGRQVKLYVLLVWPKILEGGMAAARQGHFKMKSTLDNSNIGIEKEETKPVARKRRNLQGFFDEVPERIYLALVRTRGFPREALIKTGRAPAAIQEALTLEASPPQAVRRLT